MCVSSRVESRFSRFCRLRLLSVDRSHETWNMTDKKQPVDLGLLEEDDEFEEFPAEDWAGLDEDEDAHVWEDNWDDDNVEDDFSNQLRAELEKHGYKMET
uniref:26S proteasome complex subunit SEM1 n=1 Tax=Geotrypetes seraphini TaxID=260995 RepID=A0A6P8QHR4_GEOSA|nr:26S proteasome complex subunit SEM1 [Geotrypetes seraphini]